MTSYISSTNKGEEPEQEAYQLCSMTPRKDLAQRAAYTRQTWNKRTSPLRRTFHHKIVDEYGFAVNNNDRGSAGGPPIEEL